MIIVVACAMIVLFVSVLGKSDAGTSDPSNNVTKPDIYMCVAQLSDLPLGNVGGSSLPTSKNGTCLVYCRAGEWQVREGGLAEAGKTG